MEMDKSWGKKCVKKKVLLLSDTHCSRKDNSGTSKNIKLIFQQTLNSWRSSASYICMCVPWWGQAMAGQQSLYLVCTNCVLWFGLQVKQSMKRHKSNKTLQRVLHSRQLGLKLIANVTYGYTSANFSGRMPCIEVYGFDKAFLCCMGSGYLYMKDMTWTIPLIKIVLALDKFCNTERTIFYSPMQSCIYIVIMLCHYAMQCLYCCLGSWYPILYSYRCCFMLPCVELICLTHFDLNNSEFQLEVKMWS